MKFFTSIVIPMLLAALERLAGLIETSPADAAAAVRDLGNVVQSNQGFNLLADAFGAADTGTDGRATSDTAEPGTATVLDMGLNGGYTPPAPAAAPVTERFDLQATVNAAVAAALAAQRQAPVQVPAAGPLAVVGAARPSRPPPPRPRGSNA